MLTTIRRTSTHVIFLCVFLVTCTVAIRGAVQKAEELLAQVTAALGGNAKLTDLKSLSAEGTFRRVMSGDQEMSGELELSFLFPDRFQRVDRLEGPRGMPALGMAMTLNGGESWRGPIGGGGGGMFQMRGPGPDGQASPEMLTRNAREEYWRTLLGMLPTASALSALQFAHAGTAESPDGVADVVDVTGPDGFATRLFVDSSTHLPLMLTYKGFDPRVGMRMMRVGPGGRGQRPQSREEAEQRMEEARKRFETEGPPPQVEISWYFADRQAEGGIQLPRRMSRSVGGQVFEEWHIDKYKCNSKLSADHFRKPS